ncbi:SGNH/GDSL hydrolase family protein [Deinococcus cavernae]|uniref:SGNH/GDSL hydrolase family protein n=2 Tax=Deinococcus cavernae TaxID=2320857 RepID=A0A418V7A8_9DEIO|nr:SGNH/GDSL hydrolase family protein [Deinococcus cavernae]
MLCGMTRTFQCFVALGDSVTEGIGDAVAGFPQMGAHDALALRLKALNPDLKYVNLARRGLLSSEILATQLEEAVALQPDLVSVIAGANDLLMRRWHPEQFEQDFGRLLGAFPAATERLTMTLPNFSIPIGMPASMTLRFERQWTQANEIIRRLARQHDALLLDVGADTAFHHADVWSADRVHPNARGYALVMQDMLDLLGLS